MSKTLLKMVSFVEAEILQGTAGVCLQGEIEMLVFKNLKLFQTEKLTKGKTIFY